MGDRVLLIDGDLDGVLPYSKVLLQGGFCVRIVDNIDQIRRSLAAETPDVIVLDASVDGQAAARFAGEMSGGRLRAGAPLVVVAPADDATFAGIERSPGIAGVVFKPCRPRTLLEVVEGVVRWRRARLPGQPYA